MLERRLAWSSRVRGHPDIWVTGELDMVIFNAKAIEFVFHRDGRHRAAFDASSGTAEPFKLIQNVSGTVDRDNDLRPHSQSGGTEGIEQHSMLAVLPPFMMAVSINNPQHYCRAYSSVCSARRIQLACRYENPGTILGYRHGRFQDYGRFVVERFTRDVFPYCASRPIKRRRRHFED